MLLCRDLAQCLKWEMLMKSSVLNLGGDVGSGVKAIWASLTIYKFTSYVTLGKYFSFAASQLSRL